MRPPLACRGVDITVVRYSFPFLFAILTSCGTVRDLPRGVDPGDPDRFRKAVTAVGCRVADPGTARQIEDITGQTSARLGAVAGYLARQGELRRIPGGFVLISGACTPAG